MTFILFAVGLILGTRFTVFVLIPFAVVITLACLVWGLSSQGLAAFSTWATYIASINVGFLLASLCRAYFKKTPADDRCAPPC